jgi:hypothetical protein
VQLETVVDGRFTLTGSGIDCFTYRGHRFQLRGGRLNTAVCVGVLEISGWKYHTVDNRLYFFTDPDGKSIHMSLSFMRALVTSYVIVDQEEEEAKRKMFENLTKSNNV